MSNRRNSAGIIVWVGSAMLLIGIFPCVATENYVFGLSLCLVGSILVGHNFYKI